MRHHVYIAGALALLYASGASASDLPSTQSPVPPKVTVSNPSDAYASVFGGFRSVGFSGDGESLTIDSGLFGGRLSGSRQFQNGLGVQLDATGFRNVFEASTISEYDGTFHTFTRNSNYLIGVVGQFGQSTFDTDFVTIGIAASAPYMSGMNWNRYYGGVEAQVYGDTITYYGQLAYEKTDMSGLWSELIPDATGWLAVGQVRYFVNPDLRFDVLGSYTNRFFSLGKVDLDLHIWTVGLGAEMKLQNTPFNVFSNIDYSIATFSGRSVDNVDLTYSSTRFLIGLKLNLGLDTLRDRDRNGASLDPLPHVAQPIADLISAELGYIGYPPPP